MARKEYTTVTFLIEKNLLAKVNDEAKKHKRGWKTWFVNSAIRAFLEGPIPVNMSPSKSSFSDSKVTDTHAYATFLLEPDLAGRLDEMAANYSRGWKTRAVNIAIEMFFREVKN